MVLALKPHRGGFLRVFGCGWFIREYLLGHGPFGSPVIDPEIGAPQADVFFFYKTSLIRETSADRAARFEEKLARREGRSIDPENIARLTEKFIEESPYKTRGARWHSFVVYFSNIKKLGWVIFSGKIETSAYQEHYSGAQPRKYYVLTESGRNATDAAWANPLRALYG